MPLASKHILQIAVDKVSYFFRCFQAMYIIISGMVTVVQKAQNKKKKSLVLCAGLAYSELHYVSSLTLVYVV